MKLIKMEIKKGLCKYIVALPVDYTHGTSISLKQPESPGKRREVEIKKETSSRQGE